MKSAALKINWNKDNNKSITLYFNELEVNTPFRNISPESKGAVYIKVSYDVEDNRANYYAKLPQYFMYEIQTGRLWPPTKSPVEIVDLTVNIDLEKPQIYI